ncbi:MULTISPECIES: hypothetical protein [Paenibacillus]|jgi:hypothetical protein|uniref:Uncharacterized protein n=2 Tax=Paenibacillus TaxID=44249 RepID=A0AAJ3IU42_PAEPO|nr:MULTISPECIES: hypothetical protein [Paenibacillus]MBP1176761.1 hypothetical protein [Paenibacillus sp. PvR133]MCP3743087.1 hypothetical protein [Paenibacillus sp. A3M_27_13]MDH2330956.1 hypothetical protein [Paenibacillus polymyxa]MDR6776221.1 hypothetical protein [Paenibacillus peoriae]ODA05653.1 hypothetical protein A7312_18635 [Paenibacillus polymyxa]
MSKYYARKMIFTTYYSGSRSLKIKEVRLLEAMDERQISVFENVSSDILGVAAKQQVPYGCG